MKRRHFMQSLAAGGASLTMSLSASALTRLGSDPFPALDTFRFESVTLDRHGHISSRRILEARYFRETLSGPLGIDMVAIDGGQVMLGAVDGARGDGAYECAPQCVSLAPLYLGRTAVTQEQWRTVAGLPRVARDLVAEPACFAGTDHPVECVSWYDAQEFVARLAAKSGRAYRLPTEAEWEMACRAGTQSAFNIGPTLNAELANYSALHAYDGEARGAYRRATTPVAQFAPNAFGLHDMHGNVWEWCADAWQENFAPQSVANSALRTLRGGSWADPPARLRSSSRSGYAADGLNRIIGLRIALSLA